MPCLLQCALRLRYKGCAVDPPFVAGPTVTYSQYFVKFWIPVIAFIWYENSFFGGEAEVWLISGCKGKCLEYCIMLIWKNDAISFSSKVNNVSSLFIYLITLTIAYLYNRIYWYLSCLKYFEALIMYDFSIDFPIFRHLSIVLNTYFVLVCDLLIKLPDFICLIFYLALISVWIFLMKLLHSFLPCGIFAMFDYQSYLISITWFEKYSFFHC